MKTKPISKKLTLNKTTVVNLHPEQMNVVMGGLPPTDYLVCVYTKGGCIETNECPTYKSLCNCPRYTYSYWCCA